MGTSGTAQHPLPTDSKDSPASPEIGGAVIVTGMVGGGGGLRCPRKFFSQWPLGGSTSPGIWDCGRGGGGKLFLIESEAQNPKVRMLEET